MPHRAAVPRSPSPPLVSASLAVWIALVVACGSPVDDPDASVLDAGPRDAARVDVGPADTGPPPPSRAAAAPLLQWVDVSTGTGGQDYNDIGSTYPGPALPFGMIHSGPDTMNSAGATFFNHCVGYNAADEYIQAFSSMRMSGVGIQDYGVIALMPTVGMTPERTTVLGHRSHFDDATESLSPGYYAVTLDETDVRVEITTALRAAIHRYTFAPGADAVVLLDLAHSLDDVSVRDAAIEIVPGAREIEGSLHFDGNYSGHGGGIDVFFVARFDRDLASWGVWQAGALHEGESLRAGADVGAYARFDASTDPDVQVAIAVSFLDVARARANLEAEAADLDFDRMRSDAEAAWERELARIEIEGRSDDDFRLFYTALYHFSLMPTLATEADGHYRGLDGAEHVAEGFTYYTDLSLWDTYRTFHPLVTLLRPALQRDFVHSLIAMAEQWGSYPRWPVGTVETGGMLGDPALIVLGDSWARGMRDFDVARAYALGRVAADGDLPRGGRTSMSSYLEHGYCSVESGVRGVSKTMEFAYADDALATLARAAGDETGAAAYEARGGSYRNMWDPAREFFVGRHADGTFEADFDERRWLDAYAEGNAWQYLWLAPHDVDGLAEVMGGRDALLGRLRTFFDRSAAERRSIGAPTYYWHGNEPDIHAPFLFSALGSPDESARWSSWVRRTFYRLGPEGLPGNDDAGTLSAWYILASLGIYPLAGESDFLIGSPLWTRATLHLDAGDLVIEAPDATEGAPYVRELRWDDAVIGRERIEHATLAGGGTLRFDMAPSPAL